MDETLALASVGFTHLDNSHHNQTLADDFHGLHTKRADSRTKLKARATEIQAKWLNVRFRTLSLVPTLELPDFIFHENYDVDVLPSSAPDSAGLAKEIAAYRNELDRRLNESRKQERLQAAESTQHQQSSEARRKRELYAQQKRFEQAQHRWNNLSNKMLQHQRRMRRAAVKLAYARDEYAQDYEDNRSMFSKRRKLLRPFLLKYIASLLNQATLRATWASQMQPKQQLVLPATPATCRVVRLAMLVCPNPFGINYAHLYQRFFEKHTGDYNVVFEWTVFDIAAMEFPSRAAQRCADGFFIGGPPNVTEAPDHARKSSQWYPSLLALVRELVSQGQIVGALGQGHPILAEALGGRIETRPIWQQAHNVIEERVLVQGRSQIRVRVVHSLHGEYVASLDHALVRSTLSLPVPGTMHSFVSSFKAPTLRLLSLDGYPECGNLIFTLLRMFHEENVHSESCSSSLALDWVSAAPSVARQFIQLFESTSYQSNGDLPPLLHDGRTSPVNFFAMKASTPHTDFISDTEEFVTFAAHEHATAIVLGVSLSNDGYPIVFPHCALSDLTDVRQVLPSSSERENICIQHLDLLQLKTLTILHSYQRRHVIKSPRKVPGSKSSSAHNRLQTLVEVLHTVNALNHGGSSMRVVVKFPQEELEMVSNLDMERYWAALIGALNATTEIEVTVVSFDAMLLRVLRSMRPTWEFILAIPLNRNPQDGFFVRQQAKSVARVADGILLFKTHALMCGYPCSDRIQPVAVAGLYRDAGLRVYVDANDSQSVCVLLEAQEKSPVRDQLALLLLGVDGVFTSNPHPVQDAWKFFQEKHAIVEEVRQAICNYGCTMAAQMEADMHKHDQVYHHYAHHYYKEPQELHNQERDNPIGDDVLQLIARLGQVDIAIEAARQIQAHDLYHCKPIAVVDAQPSRRENIRMAVKAPILDKVRWVKREAPPKGKRSRGFAFRSPLAPAPDWRDDNAVLSVRHSPMPPTARPSRRGRGHAHRTIKAHPTSPSTTSSDENESRRVVFHSISLPACT
ncbi:hypothetical protein AC1031_015506 [Aphanomyces cochlioides]|nr:hypothetical protein AC1031_015506 [Aphanomyces cochlioides]